MIKNIKGDLLDFPEGINVLIHGCNVNNVMGAGIAAQIKKRYPQAWEADCKDHKKVSNSENKLGYYSFAMVGENKGIANLYQQKLEKNKRALNYEAFYNGLNLIFYDFTRIPFTNNKFVFGLPKLIGCGLAGGSWKIVYSMIEDLHEKYNSVSDLIIVEWDK